MAQGLTVVGLPHAKNQKTDTRKSGRIMAVELPFWEDFSDTETSFASPDRWADGNSVRVTEGMAIRPPSLRAATLDGINAEGSPYNPNDVLAKGYADNLTSQPIDLTVVDVGERNTVFLSYQYQMKGNGELPDPGDRLLVSFIDEAGEWIPVDTIENDGFLEPTLFYTSFIQVEEEFFHDAFQFRFQNFARLSGPYDSWHVDYIYLNKGRSIDDIFFPDRTLSAPLNNLFGIYRTMPVDHFVADPSVIKKPGVVAFNLQSEPTTVNYSTTVKVTHWTGEDTTRLDKTVLEAVGDIDQVLLDGQYFPLTIAITPDVLSYAELADSIMIELEYALNTRDNDPNSPTFPGDTLFGDYLPEIYAPIDFRVNDTTRVTYLMVNKYAYDDGAAEYGAGLNQPGAQVAYQYNLVGVKEEDITHLEMYFPRFGDESSQVLELRIWNDFNDDPIYTEVTSLQRSEDNKFWLKKLTEAVHVDSVFYIGWKQSASAVIAAGLDKNTDSGDRMWYNVNGSWEQNTLIHGSLMFRPVFGQGKGEVVGLEDERSLTIYPNPSSGNFAFAGEAQMISVYDMTGRSIPFTTETTREETKLLLPNAAQGIYIIKAQIDGRMRTAKVMVR